MRRVWPIVALWLAACSQRQVADPAGSAAPPAATAPAETASADAAPADAAPADAPVQAAAEPPPPACIPRNEPDWTCPEVAVAADGDRAVVCFRERCGGDLEIGCVLVDPRTGRAVGPARWPAAPTPDYTQPNPFEVRLEGRTIAVCRDGACNRLRDALPAELSGAASAVDVRGRQVFIAPGDFTATTYDVAASRRIARLDFEFKNQPPPPVSGHEVAYHGRGVLLGDFHDPGIIELALDPVTGRRLLFTKPWARLPGDLVVHFTWSGEVDLHDFDAHLQIVAKRKAGRPHQPTEAASGAIVNVGEHALVVTQDPPATLLVDSKARTISAPRPLPLCPPS